jgi:hypothetical protein
VAIVTGAGNGLGRAYAEYLGRLGAHVLVNDPQAAAADEVVQCLGGGDRALANYDTVEEGHKVVDAALDKCRLLSYMGKKHQAKPDAGRNFRGPRGHPREQRRDHPGQLLRQDDAAAVGRRVQSALGRHHEVERV